MKEVETPQKSKPESPNLLRDPGVQISPAKTTKENGARVSADGKEGANGIGGDLDGAGVGESRGTATRQMSGGKESGLEDSEINGASSLLKMQESKALRGLDSVLVVIDQNEKMEAGNRGGDGNGDGVSLVADVCEDVNVNPSDVKERRRGRRSLPRESRNASEEHSDGKNREVEEEEESGGEGHDFGIGDFVWGKIRSHPWWPGRVYDTVDASDFAMKVKQRDKILVAYFGDGTFAWCNPSQLKPLDENFVEMSRQSNSKNFVNAVEKAMDEVGRLVDLRMTCSCVPKENLIGFGRTLAVNAGIKEGLLIPEGGIHKLSSALFEPAEFLALLKGAAQAGNITNILGITVLKSWLSAFYRAKTGHQLPSYYDPQSIPGLDDDSGNRVVDLSNNGTGTEVRNQGPVEEDWLSSPRKRESTDNVLQRCQGGTYQRRKQKSLAEILEGKTNAEVENKDDVLAEEVTTPGKSTSSAKRKRKPVGENMSAENEVMNATEGATLEKPATSSRRKKRKVSGKADSEGKNKIEDIAEAGENLGKLNPSSGGKKKKGNSEAHVDKDDSSAKGSATAAEKRTRKATKLSESVTDENIKVTGLDADASMVKKESSKTPLSRGRKKKGSSDNIGDDNGKDKNEEMRKKTLSAEKVKVSPSDDGEAEEQIRKGSLLRERKRSKYLSPPYTNLKKGQRKSEVEAESPKVSSECQFVEGSNKASSKLTGRPQILEPIGEKLQKKAPGATHETSDGSVQQDLNKIVDPVIIKAPPSDVLSKMRSAARNPLYLNETSSVDVVGEFVSAFRNYCNTTDSKSSELYSGKKRKSQKCESGSLIKEQNQADQSSPQQTKTKKRKEAKLDQPKVKQTATASDMKKKNKEPSEEFSGAALFVTFGPGSSLPTKDDIVNIYRKYGALNNDETEMFYANYCARIVFLKTSEAEEAFNQSQLSSPFKSVNATFRLRYLSADTKTRQLRNIPSSKSSSTVKDGAGVPSASQSTDTTSSQLNFIKQKLEAIQSLLETSGGKIPADTKSTIEGEIKVILEKVSSMVDSSS